MDDLPTLARDPEHRRTFEKLLFLAARQGNADIVIQRLAWGIDPNCRFGCGTTPLIANVRGFCPSAATVRALLGAGADPELLDEAGLTALDYARRKLAKLQARPRRPRPPSPSLDENGQLKLRDDEQAELDRLREMPGADAGFFRIWWQERLRIARRVFNDPVQVEEIVSLLEATARP
jgi:hypothetical protein